MSTATRASEAGEAPTRSVLDVVEELDGGPYFDILAKRFQIPHSTFARYVVFQPNRNNLWIADRDLLLPGRPEHHTVGMPFFYVNMRFPRLTTAAAVKFGPRATRNVFDVQDHEVAQLLFRDEIDVDGDPRAETISSHGYVMLRHRGWTMGLGLFRDEDDGRRVRGMLPRSWTARLGIDAPTSDDSYDPSEQ